MEYRQFNKTGLFVSEIGIGTNRFGHKVDKKDVIKHYIKLIRSGRSEKTGALRFNEEMIQIPDGKNTDAVVKDLLADKA